MSSEPKVRSRYWLPERCVVDSNDTKLARLGQRPGEIDDTVLLTFATTFWMCEANRMCNLKLWRLEVGKYQEKKTGVVLPNY